MALTAEKTAVVASFAPSTNAEARSGVHEAGEAIPLVEVRLDAFAEKPDFAAIRAAWPGKTLVATLRSRAEGGRWDGPSEAAARLYAKALAAGFDLVDVEFAGDGAPLPSGVEPDRAILSKHDLSGVPADLDSLADGMLRTGARFVKIVGTAHDSRDSLRLLAFQRRRADGKLASFGMGEAGLATRVLAPYLGASLAYGSLGRGRETASGQVPARDLVEVYGVGRRRSAERLVALFGGVVSHSLSPALHNAFFEATGEKALYVPFALSSLLLEFDPLVVALDGLGLPLKAASVTIPFKEEASAVAVFRGESVVNTLVRSGDAYVGSNTDRAAIAGFTPLAAPGSRALVLGAGGTARVAVEALLSRRWDVFVWNRNPVSAHDLAEETGATFLPALDLPAEPFGLLVNATPVGMREGDGLPCPEELLGPGLVVIDAPYRPGGTLLSERARERGARVHDGFSLLLSQAAKQAELFTGRPTTAAELLARLPERFRAIFEEAA